MQILLEQINNKQWLQISQRYTPSEIANMLSFREGMLLGHKILLNEEMDDDLREYAVNLLDEVRKSYPVEWSSDWKNEVFLGDAFYLVLRLQERYGAYKRAFDKVIPTPPALLVSIAGCYLMSNSPITMKEAENFLREALEQEKSLEAVILIRGICKAKGDLDQFSYWDEIFQELKSKDAYMKNKWPSILECL